MIRVIREAQKDQKEPQKEKEQIRNALRRGLLLMKSTERNVRSTKDI